jgi:hypothetical protein
MSASPRVSDKRHSPATKIDSQALLEKEVKAQQAIHAPALGGNVWAKTGQKGKRPALLPQGANPIQNDARHKLDSATGRDLDAVGPETWVIADGD